jgi:hypothetical protein
MLHYQFVDLRKRYSFFHSWLWSKNIMLDMIEMGAPKTKPYVNEMLAMTPFRIMMKAKVHLREKR